MSEAYGYVYEVVNHVNGKVYVGQTRQAIPTKRWNNHKTLAYRGSFKSPLYPAIRKYGVENFTFEVITSAKSQEELDRLERTYIEGLNAKSPKGYNITDGGASPLLTDESKKKISLANTGKVRSQEAKDKVSRANKGRISSRRLPVIASDGTLYLSIAHAAEALEVKRSNIHQSIKKGYRCRGLKFQYAN